MKNFLNLAITIICLSFFLVAETNAQINVLSDNSAAVGSTYSNNAKFRVYNTNETYSIQTENRKSSGTQYGVHSTISSTSTGSAYGIYSKVYQKTGATGLTRGFYNYNYAKGSGNAIAQYNYIYGNGATGNKYGCYNYIYDSGSSAGTKYGVFSRVLKSSTATGTMYAGYFLGDVYISGATLLWVPTPGQNQKQGVTNALDKLTTVNTFAATNMKDGKQKTSYSLDPTSLKQAFPELVVEVDRTQELVPQELTEKEAADGVEAKETTENNGIETAVDVNSLIPVLVEAIKEQQKQIETLKAQIKAQ